MEELYTAFSSTDYADLRNDDETVPNTDTETLCQIMYTDEYKQLIGICHSLIVSNEYTPRSFRLTTKLIELAPAYYTVWNYRFNNILTHLLSSNWNRQLVIKEFDWLDEITLNNPKNYQIWSYRQQLIVTCQHHHGNNDNGSNDAAIDIKRELPILDIMIDEDTKNYHVWSYRKWVVQRFDDFTNELPFINKLIDRDIYNNSAWNHRMFYLQNVQPDDSMLQEEIKYTMEKIKQVPQNISSWNYLRGIYDSFLKPDDALKEFVMGYCRDIPLDSKTAITSNTPLPDVECSFAIEVLAQLSKDDPILQANCYRSLSVKYDPIRTPFWQHKLRSVASN